MTRRLPALLMMFVLCGACSNAAEVAQAPSPASATSAQPPTKSSAPQLGVDPSTTSCVNCDALSLNVINPATAGTLGQAVPATWPTGAGTVTLNKAEWLSEAEADKRFPGNGWGSDVTQLEIDVTYSITTGAVPVLPKYWRVGFGDANIEGINSWQAGSVDFAPNMPDDSIIKAGETLTGQRYFKAPSRPLELRLDDGQNVLIAWSIPAE